MTYYVFDSSALVKRYVTERATPWVRATVAPEAGNTIFIAQITQVEIVSALMRRSREGHIPERTARAARLYVDRHCVREYQVIRLVDTVAQRAEDLLQKHQLRAFDALQLASALEVQQRMISSGLAGLVFVTADQRLLSAAEAEGMSTDNPDRHE